LNPLGSAFVLFASIVFAAVLQLLPLSGYYLLWRPNFLLLITLAWIIFRPSYWGIGFAAILGFLADIIFRAPVGLYLLVFGITSVFPLILSRWLIHFTALHRCLFVFILVLMSGILENTIFGFWGVPPDYGSLPMKAVFSSLVWLIIDPFFTKVLLKRY
jgi:rod shape-determining protein MreD